MQSLSLCIDLDEFSIGSIGVGRVRRASGRRSTGTDERRQCGTALVAMMTTNTYPMSASPQQVLLVVEIIIVCRCCCSLFFLTTNSIGI